MKHFDITQWADYVRGLNSAAITVMREHLNTGCRRCESSVVALQRIAVFAESESEHAPPDYAVRCVKAFFGLQQPERLSLLAKLGLEIKFDTALAPASVGVRGDSIERQLLLESESHCLELRMERQKADAKLVMEGFCRRQDGRPVALAPVFLVAGGEVTERSKTGDFGEFHFAGQLTAPLELWIFGEDAQPIAASLATPAG